MTDPVRTHFDRHLATLTQVAETLSGEIRQCADQIARQLERGGKVLIMGNGGSAADAQHFAAELVGRFLRERRALPAVALSTDTSILTAVGNDYGFDAVFRRQVEALAAPADVVIGISTSGNSPNVLAAVRAARAQGCLTIGLLGRDGGSLRGEVDRALVVASPHTPHIQEAHLTIIHILCDLIEQSLGADGSPS